jgi:high-affinity nickel-transport protein
MLATIALGFLLGMRHATDADHVVAVATIVARKRSLRPAAAVGALWGVGHAVTLLLAGSALLLFNLAVPPAAARLLEAGVGVMLMLLGLMALLALRRPGSRGYTPLGTAATPRGPVLRRPQGNDVHIHGGLVHGHIPGGDHSAHGHPPLLWLDRLTGRLTSRGALRPVVVGIVHALAGSAPLLLIVLGTVRDPWWGIAYLLAFGIGTIAGMILVTAVIALPFVLSAAQLPRLNAGIQVASGVLSVGFGAYLLQQALFVP